jgi:hypothetical protein
VDLSEASCLVVADPVMSSDERLPAAWFIHPRVDVIREIATLIDRVREDLNVTRRGVLLYGSSVGGYAGLSIGAHLPGVQVLAEVPQLDVQRWTVPSWLDLIEALITRESLTALRCRHPERVSVLDRFRYTGFVPRFTLLTNAVDPGLSEQLDFMQQLSIMRDVNQQAERSLTVTSLVRGHSALSKRGALALIRQTLLSWDTTGRDRVNGSEPSQEPEEGQLIHDPQFASDVDGWSTSTTPASQSVVLNRSVHDFDAPPPAGIQTAGVITGNAINTNREIVAQPGETYCFSVDLLQLSQVAGSGFKFFVESRESLQTDQRSSYFSPACQTTSTSEWTHFEWLWTCPSEISLFKLRPYAGAPNTSQQFAISNLMARCVSDTVLTGRW